MHPNKTTSPEPQIDEASEPQKALSHPSYEELENKLNDTEAQLNDAKNQLLRNHAEVDNIRKRAEKDIQNAHKYGLERLISELLPVIDGLERGMSIEIGDNEFARNMHAGLEMTLSLLLSTLEKFSVKVVDPLQQPFDPSLHQAISTTEDPDAAPNTVLQVLQKGYLLHDRLIRPALVIVSQ